MQSAAVRVDDTTLDTDTFAQETAQLVREIGIPPCPAILVDFMAETRKDEPDFRRISHLVNKDVALAASILKTVNSPYYGLTKKARTVQEALTLLGLQQVGRLIAGLLLRQVFASAESPAMNDYWDSSAKIGLLTGYLARELDAAKLDEAHTFALFRDCGVPVLLTRYPEYEQVLSLTRTENERGRSRIEQSRFGFDHALVGATLAQTWHLPRETWQAIRVHNTFDTPAFAQDPNYARIAPLVATALLAEQLYRVNRGTFAAESWGDEEAFIVRVLGPMEGRLEPLTGDILRLVAQA